MDQRAADVEREIAVTREQMSRTIDEIETRLADTASAVKQKLDVMQFVADHPWSSLALAFAAGLVLSTTGADRKAATSIKDAAVDAAKGAGPAIASLADRAKGAVRGPDSSADAPADSGPGFVQRVAGRVGQAMGMDDLRAELQRGATLE